MTERPTMLAVLSEMAQSIAQRSTCDRLNVGALIYDDRGVILSGGYNGALAGMPHCIHPCGCGAAERGSPADSRHSDECDFVKPCLVSMHAEANAIVWAARRGVATEGHNLIVTQSPCYRCSQLIIQAGIKSVRFLTMYRDGSGLALMLDAGLMVSPVV